MKSRTCTYCRNSFPFNEEHFYRNRTNKCGFGYTCKICAKSLSKQKFIRKNTHGYERIVKRCRKCDYVGKKFYFNKRVCSKCESKVSAEWARKNPKRKQILNKKYLKTAAGKDAIKRGNKKFKTKYPQKRKAHQLVQTAIRSGALSRKSCEICGTKKAHAHHEDYSKPLEVIWLCVKCHLKAHKNLIAFEEKEGMAKELMERIMELEGK